MENHTEILDGKLKEIDAKFLINNIENTDSVLYVEF